VHDWLRDERKGKWVLILDNVDDASFLLDTRRMSRDGQTNDENSRPLVWYLPQSQNGSILITTRSREAARKLVIPRNIIAVEPMSKADALALFEKKLGAQNDSNDVAALAYALEYMPLAIIQASAYICEQQPFCSVKQYLADFQDLLSNNEEAVTEFRRDYEAKNSIILTWQISFDHIRQKIPSAANLLSLMSFFDCQGIPGDLLRNRSESGDGQQTEYKEDSVKLRNYSFISINTDGKTFEMHSLVQLATRKWLEDHGQLEKWKQQFISNLCAELPTGEYENWAKCQELFPHARSAARQQPQAQESLRDWASVLYKAAWYAWTMGNGLDAENMSFETMKVWKKILGEEHEDSLNSMAMLGLAHNLRGRWDAAEGLFVQVMETRKAKLGADHPDTLTSMANLASTYRNQGRWEDAEELFVQVMETSKTKLGADHPSTLTSMANLASTFWNQGRWGDAEELEVQVMETSKTKLGADHPDTLTSMANLASTYRNQGRWGNAEELFVQVMETRKTKLGADHPSTLMAMWNLAYTWKEQGRTARALILLRECVHLQRQILKSEHPHYISSSRMLADWEAKRDINVSNEGSEGSDGNEEDSKEGTSETGKDLGSVAGSTARLVISQTK